MRRPCWPRASPDVFFLGHLGIEGHVERRGPVDHYVAELAAVGHLCNYGTFGRRRHRRQELLGGRYAGYLRSFDTQ